MFLGCLLIDYFIKKFTIFMKNIRKNVKKLATPFFFNKKFLKVLYKPMALKEFMLKYNLLSLTFRLVW